MALKERQIEIREGLPFLYGWKWYPWALDFFESSNKLNFLCAANQISKSSTQIRKCIDWATNQLKWPSLWKNKPIQFWYLYPTGNQARIEFETKWQQFLPKGKFKDDPVYGWRAEYKANREIFAIHFNSGVHVYFKTYAQDSQALQTGTCFVAGTKVLTPFGEVPIESLKVGATVLSKDGWKKIKHTFNRPATVITVGFSHGRHLTGTHDHPIWTENRGWVSLGDLTDYDVCSSYDECISQTLSCSTERNTSEATRQKLTGVENTTISVAERVRSIWRSGRDIAVSASQKVTSFTIGMRTQLTIGSRISSSLRGPSTLPLTGVLKRDAEPLAPDAKEFSSPVVLKLRQSCIAVKLVTKKITEKAWSVYGAGQKSGFVKTHPRSTVRTFVSTEPRTSQVYNIEVEDSHTYFANGVLVHNCDAVFCDEELPVELYEELIFRISASDGYFHMVFTATLGQEFWRLVIDPGHGEEERLPGAFKQTVSMYDCLKYTDGTPSHWTNEKIQVVINRCSNENEVLKRVWGKFIMDSGGKKYEQYNMKRHMKPGHELPKNWMIFAGIDSGSGGQENHPAAICFVAVDLEFRQARVFKAWRGDKILTSAGDVLEKYIELKGQYKVVAAYYDWGDKDLETIAGRMGIAVQKADKSHETGEQILNTLFKNDMLLLYEDPETQKLSNELSTLRKDQPKRKAKDDLCDALRYAVTRIPWDWSVITGDLPEGFIPPGKEKSVEEQQIDDRRARFDDGQAEEQARIDAEFAEANELYGN